MLSAIYCFEYLLTPAYAGEVMCVCVRMCAGADPGGAQAPLITKNEAPAPKFYKIEVPEWQF